MLKNFFTLSFRRLWKMRSYSIINIGRMAVAIAGGLLLFSHIQHERSFDTWHTNAGRIYRLNIGSFDNDARSAVSSGAMAPAFAGDFPEIEHFTRFRQFPSLVKSGGTRFYEDGFYYTDSTVFDVFDFRLKEGNPALALAQPFSIVLTEAAAKKYFGDQPAIGKQLEIDNRFSFQVTGVLAPVPGNSHFKFDFLASVSSLRQHPDESVRYWQLHSWFSHYYHSYLLLKPGADAGFFLKLVLAALVIASPLAWFFMEKWLQDFAYRIDMPWWVFAAAGVTVAAVPFLTVGVQGVRAALANPVQSLRSE